MKIASARNLLLACLLAPLLLASAASAAPPVLDPNHPLAREVVAREHDLRAALLAGDEAKVQAILAPEFLLMNNIGLNTRDSYLDGIVRKRKMNRLEVREARGAVYGDSAIVWARLVYESFGYGKTSAGEAVITDVWHKRDGQWVLVSRHTTTAAPPPAAPPPAPTAN